MSSAPAIATEPLTHWVAVRTSSKMKNDATPTANG